MAAPTYLLLPFLLFCNRVAAQLPVHKEPHHQLPVQEEPHHKVVLENEYIRLLDGHIPAHDTTLAHIHAANSVVVFLSKSTFGIQIIGDQPVITEVSPGDMKYVAYGDKPVTHIVWNQDTPMFHFLVVEMPKQHPDNDTCPILSQPGLKFQWQHDAAKAYYLDLTKGSRYHLPGSNCAYLLINISGIVSTRSSGGSRSIQADGFAFFPPQKDIEINDGNKENARCILLEIK